MAVYRENLKLLSDNYYTRLGFDGDKLIIDSRYFVGFRAGYDINNISENISKSFSNYLNLYELKKYFIKDDSNNSSDSSDNEIDDISITKFNIFKYESLIENALNGLLYMSSNNNYYTEEEHDVLLNIYNKYIKIYNKINGSIRADSVVNINTPTSINSDSTVSSILSDKSSEGLDIDIKYIQPVDEEVSDKKPTDCIVKNPAFDIVYINEIVLDHPEDEVVYDKYNLPTYIEPKEEPKEESKEEPKNKNRGCCRLLKNLSQLLSSIKRGVHNAYKSIISFFL